MPGRNKPLITRNGIPDPQAYNPQTGQWESFIGVSWGKTAGGLYVPIRVDDQGRQEVTLSGTIIVNPPRPVAWITASATVSKIEKVKGREASLFVWTDTGMRVKVRGLSGIDKTSADPVSLENVIAGRVIQLKIPAEVLPADNLELIFENPVEWALQYQYQLVWGV